MIGRVAEIVIAIPPVTHARDLRSAPVAPLIPFVSIYECLIVCEYIY